MENISEFDLNASVRLWLEKLAQSPHFRNENVAEMETHVRDSITRLQSQGLSAEESFLIAIRRVGSVEKLEPEFAKVNRSPWNMIIHGLILAFFSIGCWFLWILTQVMRMTETMSLERSMPAFSRFVMGCGPLLAVPPLLALIYCLWRLWAWIRRSAVKPSWVGFFATTVGVILLFLFPIIAAALLPFVK